MNIVLLAVVQWRLVLRFLQSSLALRDASAVLPNSEALAGGPKGVG